MIPIGKIIILVPLMVLAYLAGHFRATWDGPMTYEEAQVEVADHLACLQRASMCRMQVDDFRLYHHAKRVVEAYEDAEQQAKVDSEPAAPEQ